ncbi:acyl--CoA ligase [Streptosporangiaceae bacterium NEAU-GS5]|nr:acyl--CoA ligase [Streptosporangiaceae bacterium NEAU-GS5]
MSDRTHRLTFPDLLSARAAEEPHQQALVVEGVGAVTFRQWHDRSTSVARELISRGVQAGDRIGLLFGERDWVDYAVATCAVHMAGAVAVPVSDRLAPAEVEHVLTDCAVTAVVHGQAAAAPCGAWQAAVAELDTGDATPLAYLCGPDDLAQILYTSGTTGRPKGVGATHANLTFGCLIRPKHRKLSHSRHFLHAFPIGSNAGQTMLVNALDAKPAALTLPRFTPGRFARLIESYRTGTVFLVPAMAIELLNADVQARHDLSCVTLLGSTAATLPPAVATGLAKAFPRATIVNYYTSTEAAPAQTVMVVDPDRPGSVGRPAAGSGLAILDAEGRRLAAGQSGEVWMRSAGGSRAYFGSAQDGVFRDGWVRMGDIGYLAPDGYLYLVDRESDVVKSGAFKISTLQVEAALFEHPEVAEAAVVGVPHPVLGTAVAAAVVRRGAVSADDLRVFLMDRLAKHELPTRVLFLDALPRNHNGKVIKRELRDLISPASL